MYSSVFEMYVINEGATYKLSNNEDFEVRERVAMNPNTLPEILPTDDEIESVKEKMRKYFRTGEAQFIE